MYKDVLSSTIEDLTLFISGMRDLVNIIPVKHHAMVHAILDILGSEVTGNVQLLYYVAHYFNQYVLPRIRAIHILDGYGEADLEYEISKLAMVYLCIIFIYVDSKVSNLHPQY
jgi:hypothetical protein